MSEPVPPAFDALQLMADMRRGDAAAIDQAYRMTFGNGLGRLVLAHHLVDCGFGDPLGTENLKYAAGKIDGALELAAKAGFGQASLAVAVLTDELIEERTPDEPAFYYPDALAEDDR